MGAGIDDAADLLQMLVHGRGVASGHDETGALAFLGADRSEDVGMGGQLVLGCRGPASAACPATGQSVLLADTGFVLLPNLDRRAG